ncbi:tetratricopeptide repeat protein [Variovorax sp. 770b2]|jgi:predicted negative regulator of RcsB-dependent stress response|uniref:YfgM family protein n=1 Tax=Variovorax sp. 770b2 TaxID=1566271 RepID=UPI0008E05C93|nr:tetratricopeptide repeat protein [Variovorax sp. 770b2]SFP28019.1 Putative negative regulator of RcsB-dependent stress response [Variovorax sp. 770b2]
MATHLDLEEQEQLDQLKHFWNTYGTLITWAVLLVAGAFVAWNGWQYFQRSKAAQAAALYDEVERSTQSGDVERIQRVLGDMKERFAGTAYAQQAGLLAAKTLYEKGKVEESRAALGWVAQSAIDPGYQAIAKLRLAAELLDGKSYDEALKQLDGKVPKEFEPLVADRKGDIYMAQGKRDEAQQEYRKAWTGLGATSDYRRLVEIKLNAVGVDPKSLAPTITVTPAASKTS